MYLKTLKRKRIYNPEFIRDYEQNLNKKHQFGRGLMIGMFVIIFLFMTCNSFAQRYMEHLTRGLVAVKTSENVFLSWRIFASDDENLGFNLYRNDTLVNSSPITGVSNYVDPDGYENSIYYLETVLNNSTIDISTPVTVWNEQYKTLPLQLPGDAYYPNDCSVADLDGDGEMEIIVKIQTSNPDNTGDTFTDPVYLHAYKLNGVLLWSINLGVNIRAGSHYTQFMVYDLDGDGLAEVACKTAPGTTDGTGEYLSDGPAADDDDSASYVNSGNGTVLSGPEYLTVFSGTTGQELSTAYYVPRRHPDTENPTSAQLTAVWGDGYGNRVDRFLACVAYFDDIPSLVMCRGYYTRTVLAAWDLTDGELTQRWVFDTDEDFSDYAGQGNHNLSVADVDNDGKDEIIYGAMCVDDDGTGLWTTGLGHGDAMHVSDIDPDRPGLEKWGITESGSTPGSQLLDAATGEVIWETGDADVARGTAGDLSADYYGIECWGGTDGLRSCKNEAVGDAPSAANFVIWWDGDLLRELLNSITISKWYPDGEVELISADGCLSNNGTKATPSISGDILGDWREEVVFKTEDDQALRIYTPTTTTEYGIYTLLQDPQYRLALTWQNVGYNQPPHTSFFLGDGMDLDSLPDPDITISDPYKNPSIFIQSPVDSFELGLGLNLDVIVHVTGISETNSAIIIYDGTTPLDTILAPPYYASIPELSTGEYTLTATAYNVNRELMTSDSVHVTVDEGYPHVAFTSPTEGYTFMPEELIDIAIKAYDTDGSIDSVIVYLNDSAIANFSSAPYSIEIENPGIGIHELKAIAYDNEGKSTGSDVLDLEIGLSTTIQEEETGFCGFPDDAGTIDSDHTDYTGIGFANTSNISGAQIIWAINVEETATYKFEWKYSSTSTRAGNVYINDTLKANLEFPFTADYDTWSLETENIFLYAGITEVILEATSSEGLSNIDYMKMYSLESSEEIIGIDCDSLISENEVSLSDLSVAEAELSPTFDSTVFEYVIILENGTSEINISATATDPDATVEGTGKIELESTSGSVAVVVTSRNGKNTGTYTVNYSTSASVTETGTGTLQVYPVPARNYLNVSLNNTTEMINNISIYSVDGKKILTTNSINSYQTKIQLPDMQNGIFIMHINTKDKCYRTKFHVNK